MSVTFEKRVAELATRFAQGLPERFAAIDRLAAHLRAGGAPDGAAMLGDKEAPLRELRRRLHEIAGVSATFGFARLGATARGLELPLADAVNGMSLGAEAQKAALADPCGALEAALAADRAAAGL